jgi:hypothetical protein
LTKLPTEIAEILSDWEGVLLTFPRLEEVSEELIMALFPFKKDSSDTDTWGRR